MKKYCFLVVLVTVGLLLTNVVVADYVYVSNGSQIGRFDADLTNYVTLLSGITGITDIAVNSTGPVINRYIYGARPTDGAIHRISAAGGWDGAIASSAGGFQTVAVGPDGYVYVSNGSEVGRFDADLTNYVTLLVITSVSDLAVSGQYIYGARPNGSGEICRISLTGGWDGYIASLGSAFETVSVGPDGYVYVSNGSQVGRFDADLTNYQTLLSITSMSDLAVSGQLIYGARPNGSGAVHGISLAGGWDGAIASFANTFETVAFGVGPVCNQDPVADLNGDCKVDFTDFAIMASEWLQCNLLPESYCSQ